MDLKVTVEKRDAQGNALPRSLPQGGTGLTQAYRYQRASRRKTDPLRSTDAIPFLSLDSEALLSEGEVVPLDIDIWPMGLRLHAGEILQVTIEPYVDTGSAPPLGTAKITIPKYQYTYYPSEQSSDANTWRPKTASAKVGERSATGVHTEKCWNPRDSGRRQLRQSSVRTLEINLLVPVAKHVSGTTPNGRR